MYISFSTHTHTHTYTHTHTHTHACHVLLHPNLLYTGEFGIVYRGSVSGWKKKYQELVAIKTLKSNIMKVLCKIVLCNYIKVKGDPFIE